MKLNMQEVSMGLKKGEVKIVYLKKGEDGKVIIGDITSYKESDDSVNIANGLVKGFMAFFKQYYSKEKLKSIAEFIEYYMGIIRKPRHSCTYPKVHSKN